MSDVRGWHLPFLGLLPTGLAPCQINSKQAQLQLMGWIGSLSSFCLQKTSAHPANTPPEVCIAEARKYQILTALTSSFSWHHTSQSFKTRSWMKGCVMWRSQTVGNAISDGFDSTMVWSQGLLSLALISHKHTQPKQWQATFLIAQITSWYNYTIRKLTRQCVCCSRSMYPTLYVRERGRQRGWVGERRRGQTPLWVQVPWGAGRSVQPHR